MRPAIPIRTLNEGREVNPDDRCVPATGDVAGCRALNEGREVNPDDRRMMSVTES